MDGITTPFFSIVIPTLNSEKTLPAALDSVLHQQFTHFEVWIIDSVSRDHTLSIVNTYGEKDGRIRLVSEKDKGIYDAMNKGIRLAGGSYIFFLGSDDWLHDDGVLGSVFEGLKGAISPDLLYGNVVGANYKGHYDGEFSFEKLLKKNISHQAIFYKRDLFDKIGYYNLSYRAHADWDLNIRCFADSRLNIKYLDRVIAEFGAGGISAGHDLSFIKEVLIPEKLKMLEARGTDRLRSLPAYDDWWRVLRNAGIRDELFLKQLSNGHPTPRCLKNMLRWQRLVPQKTLRIGVLSKCLMFASYLNNLLTAAI